MKEIKIGDYVRMKHPPFEGQICQITGIPKEGMYLTDRCSLCTDAHFEPIAQKTAFLTELQALMKRYNATIDVDGDECALWLIIDIDGHAIEYVAYDYYTGKEKQTALTPDNIFNYDKE